ncbi:hypothetical protein Syn6312_3048 [Synechococcus sp. PCC 6312]|nr:hypothetical protein Syn6312_3048 [Synechococcus sp. PCC 6312]
MYKLLLNPVAIPLCITAVPELVGVGGDRWAGDADQKYRDKFNYSMYRNCSWILKFLGERVRYL